MPFRIKVNAPLIHVEGYGELVAADLPQMFAEMKRVAGPLRCPPRVLVTCDGVTAVNFEYANANAHSDRRSQLPMPGRVKSATVADRPLTLGVARMFMAINENPNLDMRVFPTLEEAMAWLNADEDAAPFDENAAKGNSGCASS